MFTASNNPHTKKQQVEGNSTAPIVVLTSKICGDFVGVDSTGKRLMNCPDATTATANMRDKVTGRSCQHF
jgi:hypothetical protein